MSSYTDLLSIVYTSSSSYTSSAADLSVNISSSSPCSSIIIASSYCIESSSFSSYSSDSISSFNEYTLFVLHVNGPFIPHLNVYLSSFLNVDCNNYVDGIYYCCCDGISNFYIIIYDCITYLSNLFRKVLMSTGHILHLEIMVVRRKVVRIRGDSLGLGRRVIMAPMRRR
jgi:hypothetical protein